jgi:hypothetical protein
MPYTALPDRRMPWDNDGTVCAWGDLFNGVTGYPSGAQAIILNGPIYTSRMGSVSMWWFFPESREVTGTWVYGWNEAGNGSPQPINELKGSNDSTNGLDGTWETASMPSGFPARNTAYDWRGGIVPVSFTGGKKVIRTNQYSPYGAAMMNAHWFGEKVAGQTPDDIIFINHDDTPGGEYTACEDFGDQPLATTVVRQFRLKNTSATKTANTINIQCNDTDFAISTDNVNWVVTINLASLAAGAESPTYYVRCTTPAVGALLGPRFARIVTTVASYT